MNVLNAILRTVIKIALSCYIVYAHCVNITITPLYRCESVCPMPRQFQFISDTIVKFDDISFDLLQLQRVAIS